jgi:hypothetical protein
MDQGTVGELFMCVMQHMKCIEVRLDFAQALTSQKQKYALGQARKKVEVAINHLCDLLPDSDTVLQVKKQLDDADLVYVMLLTEQLLKLKSEDLEEVVSLIENHINTKYKEDAKLVLQ